MYVITVLLQMQYFTKMNFLFQRSRAAHAQKTSDSGGMIRKNPKRGTETMFREGSNEHGLVQSSNSCSSFWGS